MFLPIRTAPKAVFPADRLPDVLQILKSLVKAGREDLYFNNDPIDESDPADHPNARKWKNHAQHRAIAPEKGDDVSVKICARIEHWNQKAPRSFSFGAPHHELLACVCNIKADQFKLYNGRWTAVQGLQGKSWGGDRAPQLQGLIQYNVQVRVEVEFVEEKEGVEEKE
ncbi:hypothetical protein P171DRAFT_484225 [Karstenula rhodostoma CBS 690.94]|uniref:Uncharacterized protein n=1 Tax=Karstenula rhodostoma CBS 690.94 TaxID=1392251 RepID=A0A9P4UCV5_9PLEO|nr:hypothetical protein P171DRAFT_484225 [Karstenula rhodostoma CBS 690.94]